MLTATTQGLKCRMPYTSTATRRIILISCSSLTNSLRLLVPQIFHPSSQCSRMPLKIPMSVLMVVLPSLAWAWPWPLLALGSGSASLDTSLLKSLPSADQLNSTMPTGTGVSYWAERSRASIAVLPGQSWLALLPLWPSPLDFTSSSTTAASSTGPTRL